MSFGRRVRKGAKNAKEEQFIFLFLAFFAPLRPLRPNSLATISTLPNQNDRGNPSTCSATYDRIKLVEIGATWYSRVSRNLRSTS